MTGLPRLSVVCLTRDPPGMVAAGLARLRDLAVEIVVAVDDRVDPDALGPLYDVADRVVRAEYMTPFEANLAWLDAQATGDWVLQVDGDDVVSDALLARLRMPGWDNGITHAYVSYAWCWPTPDRVLDEIPWRHNFVLRLFRTTPGITSYPGRTHMGRNVVGDYRRFDEPLYHMALIGSPTHIRAEKVETYERENPGLRTQRGWAINPVAYLPEDLAAAPRTRSVPESDARAIANLLAAAESDPSFQRSHEAVDGLDGRPRNREIVTAASRLAPAPVAGDIALRSLDHEPVVLLAGRDAELTIGLTNHSAQPLSPRDRPAPVIDARLFASDGTPIGFELETPLSGPVAPGDEIVVQIAVPGVLPIRSYVFDISVRQEHGDRYDASCAVAIDVQPGRRVVIVESADGIESTKRLLGALAFAAPDVFPVVATEDVDELPVGWPLGFEAVLTSNGSLGRRATFRRAARRASIPIIDSSQWLAAPPDTLRRELALRFASAR